MKLGSFTRHPFLFGPSPVHPLERLSAHLGGARVWAKRDDCNSGLAFGGNKIRKLEYLVAEAIAQGCDTLVSIGGVQSNHTRQSRRPRRASGCDACSSRKAGSTGPTPCTTAWATSCSAG
jgi:1-aminocyclopropane-1-carboxylate deaminase/D-cysteine desulfhydrase-like pyridoxal-dependent ACC family enzyme